MPWNERTVAEERAEFVARARAGQDSMAALCRSAGISRTTGYTWMHRADDGEPLTDRSRRPHTSPTQTPPEVEAEILQAKAVLPTSGGRALHHYLIHHGMSHPPAASTIEKVLRRNGFVPVKQARRSCQSFEAAAPHDLWQMDFKGHHPLRAGRVHPFTVLDDHSRFALAIDCLDNERFASVQACLERVFHRYGLPWTILCDNGPPWGGSVPGSWTQMDTWCTKLDITLIHGRPYHPETQGKIERFHRTLKTDVFQNRIYASLADAQHACEAFRLTYNQVRPHAQLDYACPIDRFRQSTRTFPAHLPPPRYDDGAHVRTISATGRLCWDGGQHHLTDALAGERVQVVPTDIDGVIDVYFYTRRVKRLDLRTEQPVLP